MKCCLCHCEARFLGCSLSHVKVSTCGRVRGCIKGLAGNYEEALKDLDQAIEMRPDDVLAIVDRGVFRFLNGDFKAALADLDEGIRLEPLQPPAIMRLRETILQVSVRSIKILSSLKELMHYGRLVLALAPGIFIRDKGYKFTSST